MTVRVVLADDQELVRAGFAKLLDSEPGIEVVAQAATGREAIEAWGRTRADVVLMDIRMPGMDGLEATRRLRVLEHGPRILVLTTFDQDEYVFDAIKAGASGFLLKDALPEQLVEAIRVVAAGEALLAPSVTRRLIELFATRLPTSAPGLDELTGREREVLTLIAGGLVNRDIAERLVVSEATVKTHVGNVFAKLGVHDRAQAVVLAYESGLVVPGARSSGSS